MVQLRIKATDSSFRSLPLDVDMTIGIVAFNQNSFINVYPNPVMDKLTIDNITEGSMLDVYSADGRKVKSLLLENGTTIINTDDLKSGFYIFLINNSKYEQRFKILKQ
jgi:hypothetical protein